MEVVKTLSQREGFFFSNVFLLIGLLFPFPKSYSYLLGLRLLEQKGMYSQAHLEGILHLPLSGLATLSHDVFGAILLLSLPVPVLRFHLLWILAVTLNSAPGKCHEHLRNP